MRRALSIGLIAGASILLSGCVAAAVPVAAGALIAGSKVDRDRLKSRTASAVPAVAPVKADTAPIPAATPNVTNAVPPTMQYLYASGEAAALSLQSYLQLANFLIAKSSDRAVGHTISSVVLAPGSTLAKPIFEPCGDKPLAVALDVDETAILNYGFEGDQTARGGAYDQQRWEDWERTGAGKVNAVPGAADALQVARQANITVVFNSNRLVANAAGTAAALETAGLGPAVHGDTLWLQGDAGGGSGKDARRQAISAKYCVVAMVGDQLGDFSDLFNAPGLDLATRRASIGGENLEILWGQGWFMLPNPVYGSALKGGFDQVFPPETRWPDPTGGQ